VKKVAFIFSISCFQFFFAYSQKTTTINGVIFQVSSSEPISYASISIKGKPIGTVANELGKFTFHFSDSLKNDTLIISSIGFKTYKKQIDLILKDSLKNFYLDTVSIQIQPLFVFLKGETAEQIINKALKNIKKNYPKRMYYMDAFYRELSMREDKYARLIEAAVSIQDFGYDTDLKLAKIKVNEIRKSDDYLDYDLWSKVAKKVFGETNLILNTYYSDFVRGEKRNCSHTNFLCKENIYRFKFKLTGCSYIDNKLIYILSYRDTLRDSQTPNRAVNWEGNIYIQSDNYAIVKFEWGMVAGLKNDLWKSRFFRNKYLLYTIINFRDYNGKYYPNLIQTIQPVPNAVKTNSSEGKSGKQYVLTTLVVNNIITKRRNFAKVKNSEKEVQNMDIYEKKFPYHPEFWKDYNIITLNPLIQSVNIDLQKDKPLEEQFKNNGE